MKVAVPGNGMESLVKWAKDLSVALTKLDLEDNFRGFVADVTFEGTNELEIRNDMRDGSIPRTFIVVDATGNLAPSRGDTRWSSEVLYLKNAFSGTNSGKIFFMR